MRCCDYSHRCVSPQSRYSGTGGCRHTVHHEDGEKEAPPRKNEVALVLLLATIRYDTIPAFLALTGKGQSLVCYRYIVCLYASVPYWPLKVPSD